ncbi:MAG: hypothetical protein WCI92_02525 [Bacteroidota bacterium]
MQKITTYSPDQKRSAFAFFILNKGMNSGKPLEHPCPNCFTFNASTQEEKDHFYWICFGLWQSSSFHQHLIGSVIPFIRLHELNQVINQASEKAQANPGTFQKTVEALKILDRHEKQYHRNLLIISEAKKAIFANYRARPSFYR